MCSGPNPWPEAVAGPSSGCHGMIFCPRVPAHPRPRPSGRPRPSRRHCTRRPGWPTRPWPPCSSRAWPRTQAAPFAEGILVSTRTKGAKGSRGRTRLSIRYFDDRILLTDTHAWAYYRIPSVSYEFTTAEEREALATNITVALAAIRMQDAEVHLRIAHRSYPAHAWATGLDATSDGGPGWREYLEQTYQHVWSKDFWAKEIYLGVRLGQRGVRAQLSGGVFSQFRGVYQHGERGLGVGDEVVGSAEVIKWTDSSERLGRALNASALAARHATSGEIAWLIQHTLTQTAGDPLPSATKRRRWGLGEIDTLFEGQIHNGRTLLCLEHISGEAYAAFISFARFPDMMSFPDGEPWLHFADSLPFPVEISSRMKLIPPAKASKDVSRRLAHARDMDAHIREAGAEAPIALAEQIAAARMLEHGITKERLPFVYGWHRLIVSAPTRELCVRRVEAVVEHYRDIGIDVVNSTGDQFSLLCEALPGERIRLSSYVQRQPLYTIAGGMPTATVGLGDRVDSGSGWIGPYIGETLGRARSIVHFDPLVAAARNRPTAVAITGEPGAGKTTLAMLLIYQLALRGATVAVIDPKGDAESLVELLTRQGRRARVLPLGSAAPGLLDPFSFGVDLSEKRTMATETLRLLLPRMSEERESAMIQAVGAVAGTERPSLGKVVKHLEQAEDPAWKNTGAVMRSISEMRLARLCFAPSVGQQIDAEGWTTVFTLARLSQGRGGADQAPEMALDDDRRSDCRVVAHLADDVTGRPRGIVDIVVEPGRAAGLEHERAEVMAAEHPPAADWRNIVDCLAPGGNVGEHTVGVVADEARHIDRKQPRDLLNDRREHLLRRRPARHQCRDAAQRRLLLSQPGELGAAVGVRDRRRHQLGEGGQPRLGVGRHQLLAAERYDDAAPQPALGADRHADRGTQPPVAGGDLPDHAGDVAVVDPGRPAGAVHHGGHVPAAERQLAADRGRRRGARPGPGADDLEGVRRVAARYQRRYPPQRGLLLGHLTQPRLIGWITAHHPPVGGTGASS